MRGALRLVVAGLLVVAACGQPAGDDALDRGSSPTISPTAGGNQPPATERTPPPPQAWRSTALGPVAPSASVRLAAGPLGLVVSVSEDWSQPPALWFSADGEAWERVTELPVERRAIGASLVGVGPDGMVAIKVGDPEAEAFGAPSELAVWVSPDGRSWREADPGGFEGAGYLHDLESAEAGWVAAGEYAADPHTVVPGIFWSPDGLSWRLVARGEGRGSARSVVVGEDGVLVVGSEAGRPAVWRSTDGTTWSRSQLPSAGHGGEATTGAWVGDRWLVVGVGSETEPMAAWRSPDGEEWEKVGQLLEEGSPWEDRFGAGVGLDDRLAVGTRIVRFAHENFCFEGDRCFVPSVSVLLTARGTEWQELPAPPGDRSFPQPPPLAGTPSGDLAAATVWGGSLTFSVADPTTAVPFQGDPPVPELTIERAEWGQDLEAGRHYAWALYTHCGIGQLGEFNGKVWQLEDAREPVPAHLRSSREELYGVMVLSEAGDTPTITFRVGGEVLGHYTLRPLDEMEMCM